MNGVNEDFFGCQVPRVVPLYYGEVPTISPGEQEEDTFAHLMERVHNDLKGRITRSGAISVIPC